MQVRVECPACGGNHVFDMPEGTVHMTCSRTHRVIECRLTPGGDVKTRLLDGEPSPDESTEEPS